MTVPVSRKPWRQAWAAGWVLLASGELLLLRSSATLWEWPTVLFWLVVIAASGCVITSGALMWRGWSTGVAEITLLGSFFMAVSLLPLAHGITVPGVLYGPNTATMATVFWAVPLGGLAVAPLLPQRSRWANRVMTQWRTLVIIHLALLVSVFTVALAEPNAIPVPAMTSPAAIAGVTASLAICLALSYRHLQLAWVARSRGPLAVSVGAALVGSSTLVFLGTGPWTAGFWLAHGLDIGGVLAATVIGASVYRRSGSLSAVLAPIEAVTPLRALELGLDPLVREFVAALEAKDTVTRDHVVRTAHMVALVAEELDIPFDEISTVILGALLHDVGKLRVPDHVLKKPGSLNAAEFEIVKRHTIDGEQLVLATETLADLAPIVRGHHERFDGTGYPDRLAGDAIPIGARIVAVCDGFDAMANTRQYRAGMGSEKALAVLAEHAGSQWDPVVVRILTRIVDQRGASFDGDALADVGLGAIDDVGADWCGCVDAVPTHLASR